MRFFILLSVASLLFVSSLVQGQWWVFEEGDCEERNDKVAELRSILQCSTCRVRPQNFVFFSASCSVDSRGGGWQNLCLDTIETNEKDDLGNAYFEKANAHQVRVLKSGYYQISYNGLSYCSGDCGVWSRVHVQNSPIDYFHWSYQQKMRPNTNKATWSLTAGQLIHMAVHGGGGDPYRWYGASGGNGRNRMQVSFVGTPQDLPFFSGGCGHHVHAGGWHRLCLTIVEHHSTVTKQFMEHYVDGRILILKDGFYRVTAEIMPHSYNSKFLRFIVNGQVVHFHQSDNRAWKSLTGDMILALDEDDVVYVETMASGSNPYANHAHSTAGHTSRIQITRAGDFGKYKGTPNYSPNSDAGEGLKMVQGGPSVQHTDTMWHKMKFSKVLINTMPQSDAFVESDGDISIQQPGTYRIHSQANMHSSDRALKMGKIVVNGKIVTNTEMGAGFSWNQMDLDITANLKMGDIVQIWWLSSGNAPVIHAYDVVNARTFGEVIKLEY